MMLRALAFLALAFVHLVARADAPTVMWWAQKWGTTSQADRFWASTPLAAARGAFPAGPYANAPYATCEAVNRITDETSSGAYAWQRCFAANGSFWGETNRQVFRVAQWCWNGTAPNTSQPLNQQCPTRCAAGVTTGTAYFDAGTARGANPPLLACDANQCERVYDGMNAQGWALVGGVRRYFAHGEYITTGNICPATNPPPNQPAGSSPNMPEHQCGAGQVLGEINGIPTCANSDGTSTDGRTQGTTTTSAPTTNPDGSTTTTTTSERTFPDGSRETTTTTTTTQPNGSSTSTTTTSCQGDCNQDGRDDNLPRSPDGEEEGDETCTGLSPAASCHVKVNEQGTPENAGTTYDASKAALDQAKADAEALVNAAGSSVGKNTAWQFSFSLPSSCSSMSLGTFGGQSISINPCAEQARIHNFMSFLWIAATLWACISMVGRAISGS